MSQPNKTVSLPELTYSQRELLVTTLHKRMMRLEELLKTDGVHPGTISMWNDELAEVTALYEMFQSHF